jgi:LPXTG-motif cell wall-anchored protein
MSLNRKLPSSLCNEHVFTGMNKTLTKGRRHHIMGMYTAEPGVGAPSRFTLKAVLAAGLTAVLVPLSLGIMPTAANAAGETLNVTLSQTTGTSPFDADDAAGHDSSATNDVVRTNDTVSYTVGVRYEGGGTQNAPTISFSLPQGEELVDLPPFCLTGSTVTPTALPAPTVPVTATSWLTLPVQTINCIVDDETAGTSLDYKFISKVRPEVPNGTTLTPVTASATSAQVTTPSVSPSVSHSVSAAPLFDISKRLDGTTNNTGAQFSYFNACSFDTTRSCRYAEYPLTISVPAGGKGIAPLASPITFTDDLSPDVFYPSGTTSSAAWLSAGAGAADKYGARLTVCNSGVLNLHAYLANPSGGSATQTSSVRNNGTITCTQPGGPGTPVQITITGADTTAYTVPSTAVDGGPIPGNLQLVISTAIRVEIPLDAVTDLGVPVDNTVALQTHNTFTNIVATDVNGVPNQGDNPANNVRDVVERIETGDGGLSKSFVGITGRTGNTPASAFAGNQYEGLPGSGTIRDGNTVVVKGQTVVSAITYERHNIPPLSGNTFSNSTVACDVWDDTKLGLPQTFAYPGAGYTYLNGPSNGSPVWLGITANGSTSSVDPASIQNYKVEYSYTATPGNGANSGCTDGAWSDTPAGVAGATVVDGVWTGVNRVRISFTDTAAPASDYFILSVGIAMQVVSDDPTGTVLPNYLSSETSTGVKTMTEVLADAAKRERLSSYVPASAAGAQGDRLLLGQANVRLSKDVWNPRTNAFTDSAVPQYSAGANVDYRLRPVLTADVAAGTFASVVVEDCLPAYQSFVSSKRESGAAITPEAIQAGSPADATLACAAGETYVRWNLGSNEVSQVIDPIIYTVEILDTVRNGNYINTALVSSDGDGSPAAARTDTAQIQIVVPTGIKISKAVDKPIVDVNPVGIDAPRSFTWTIDFANIDSPQNVSDADVIDVLPANGQNGSAFTGTLTFNSASTTAATSGVSILYTKRASASIDGDPGVASNGSTGTTVWCSAASGGTVVSGAGSAADCPASAAEVTGLRFLRPGAFLPTDTLAVNVTMTPSGNSAGDVYENRASGRVVGVTQPVGPAVRAVTVAASSIGDYVWNDVNGNGIQDAGEPAVPGFPVSLSGTDVDGNVITRTTTTDGSGKYLFDGLPSGEYTVTFEPSGLDDTYSFTQYKQGTDAALDSDADQTTGEAPAITLGQNEQRLDVDAGLTRNQTASIVLTKVVVDPDTSDTAGDATSFPVTVTCTVPENPTPVVINTTVAADGTPTTVSDLPVGATCVIVETDTDGGVVSYSVEAGTVTTIGEPVDVTITNTFPGTSVTKKVVGAPVKNSDGSYTVTYDVTVSNTGEVPTVYTVEDELHYGVGMIIKKAEIADSPDGVELSDDWNGTSNLVIAEDVAIPVDGVHVYTVKVTATVPTSVTSGARNCEVGGSETGTGFLNSATVSTELGETTASDCASAPEETVVPKPATPTGSLPNTGANVAVGIAVLLGLLLAGAAALIISRKRHSA